METIQTADLIDHCDLGWSASDHEKGRNTVAQQETFQKSKGNELCQPTEWQWKTEQCNNRSSRCLGVSIIDISKGTVQQWVHSKCQSLVISAVYADWDA